MKSRWESDFFGSSKFWTPIYISSVDSTDSGSLGEGVLGGALRDRVSLLHQQRSAKVEELEWITSSYMIGVKQLITDG